MWCNHTAYWMHSDRTKLTVSCKLITFHWMCYLSTRLNVICNACKIGQTLFKCIQQCSKCSNFVLRVMPRIRLCTKCFAYVHSPVHTMLKLCYVYPAFAQNTQTLFGCFDKLHKNAQTLFTRTRHCTKFSKFVYVSTHFKNAQAFIVGVGMNVYMWRK